jgi:hypothetical protein
VAIYFNGGAPLLSIFPSPAGVTAEQVDLKNGLMIIRGKVSCPGVYGWH